MNLSTQINCLDVPSAMQNKLVHGFLQSRVEEIKARLKLLGADRYDLLLPESYALSTLLHPEEQILAIVYGHYVIESVPPTKGRGAILATNRRILVIDKKPLFVNCEQITYQVVNGVSYQKAGISGTVTLFSRLANIRIRTLNQNCARIFVYSIESALFDRTDQRNIAIS